MRTIATLLLLILTMGMVQADMFFQNNNPFPTQVCPQNLNNIYETTPAAIEQEKESAKKVSKSKWWKAPDNIPEETQKFQRAEDSGFIIVK